jgi:hypothetical protein
LISRIVSLVIAITAIAAATGVLVVSAAFALYAILRLYIGPSGAAACVALAAAILIGIVALVFFRKSGAGKVKAPTGTVDRLAGVLRDKPAIAAAASVAAGLLAWRNPALTSLLLRLFEPKPTPGKKRARS